MNASQTKELLAELEALNALNAASRGLIQAPSPIAIAGPPGSPVILAPALNPLIQAVRTQIDAVEKLTKVVQKILQAE